jgi:hypothetical protein
MALENVIIYFKQMLGDIKPLIAKACTKYDLPQKSYEKKGQKINFLKKY